MMQYTKNKFLLEKQNRKIEGKKEIYFASRNKKQFVKGISTCIKVDSVNPEEAGSNAVSSRVISC